MQSMIGTLPHQYSIHMSSGYNAAITTKPYCSTHFSTKLRLSFSHSSFSPLRSTSRGRPLEHILGPVTFTVCHPLTSLTDQKNRPPQAFKKEHLEEVEEVSMKLRGSGYQNISLQLLKIHEPQLDIEKDPTGYYKIKMEIMAILIEKKMCSEAWKYSEDIEKCKPKYNEHFPSDIFKSLQCELGNHEKAHELYAKDKPLPQDSKSVSNQSAPDKKDKKETQSGADTKDHKEKQETQSGADTKASQEKDGTQSGADTKASQGSKAPPSP